MRTRRGICHTIHPGLGKAGRPCLQLAAGITLTCLAAGWPSSASAQSTDVTVVAGLLAARPEFADTDAYRDAWYNTGQIGLIVGRHLSANLKVELEVSTSAEGSQYVQRLITVPQVLYPVPIASERFTRLHQISGSLVWQFFDNEWVHPFVHAGLAADLERVRWYTPAQSHYVGDPRLPTSRVVLSEERRDGPNTTTTAGFVVGGGAKLYATQRVFLRTDGRITGNGKAHHVEFRVGVGVDF